MVIRIVTLVYAVLLALAVLIIYGKMNVCVRIQPHFHTKQQTNHVRVFIQEIKILILII